MITVNGGVHVGQWVGQRGDVCSVMGELGKDFCTNFPQPFLENIYRGSYNDGSRELIPVFHSPHRNWPVHCRGALFGRFEQEGGKSSSDQYPKGP